MSISTLTYAPQVNPLVGSISTCPTGQNSFYNTSFNNQTVSGVNTLSGGDVSGLQIKSTTGPIRLQQTNAGSHRVGTITATADAAVAVACTGLNANSVIILTLKTARGGAAAVGNAYVCSVTPNAPNTAGTFSIISVAGDTSDYNYIVLDTS